MSKATYPLKLPTSIKTAATRLAKEDGVNLNQRVATAVARKVGALETAAAFFKRRAAGHSLDEVDDIPAGCRIVRRSRATSCPRVDTGFVRRPVSPLWAPMRRPLKRPLPCRMGVAFHGRGRTR